MDAFQYRNFLKIPGSRKKYLEAKAQLKSRESFDFLDQLFGKNTPRAILKILQNQRLGPKKWKLFGNELEITSIMNWWSLPIKQS